MGGLSEDLEDVQCSQEIADRQDLVDVVNKEIRLLYPICYDTYDLCELYYSNMLTAFNVAMFKTICSHFELPVKSRDKKKVLIDKLSEMIKEGGCISH